MNLLLRYFYVLTFSLLVGCVSGGRSNISPGEPPPQFTLSDLTGKQVSLSEFQGKLVLINFWASWCGPCLSEMPALQRLYSRLKDEGFVILAIGVDDDAESLRKFTEKYGLTFPVLFDEGSKIKRLYGLTGVPESFFVGRDGRLIMVPDPADNSPVVRIVGPRDWDSPTSEGRTRALLKKGRP